MALQKNKIVKGVEAGYWKIIDCDVKTGEVSLGLYASQEAGQVRDNVLLREYFNFNFPVEVVNPLSVAYGKIKESNMQEQPIFDDDGNETGKETIETNWFADATDC